MDTHRLTRESAAGLRSRGRIATLLLAALGAASAAQAAGKAGEPGAKPLDLSLPRDAGQWTGVASRVQQQERLQAGPGVPQEKTLTIRTRQQPYGTGYEARMLREGRGASFGAAAGPAAGPGAPGGGGQSAAPQGGAGKGR